MIELENTVYNSETDGITYVSEGTYPCHVAGLEGRDIKTQAGDEKQVFNITFLIADEVKSLTIPKMLKGEDGSFFQAKHEDGRLRTISAKFMQGKRFNSTGLWLTPEPPEDKRWQNRKYVEFFESLGVVFPKNAKGDSQLSIVEEEDVVGKPCYIKLNKEYYEKDGEQRFVWKAMSAFPWLDGAVLDPDEVSSDDVPF